MAINPEKLQYCREYFIKNGDTLSALSKRMGIALSSLRKHADDEDWRIQRARYLIAERHRLQHDDGINFESRHGPKTNELHDLCVSLYCQKDMQLAQIAKLTGVPAGTIRRWKIMECWDEQQAVLRAEQAQTPPADAPDAPDYRQVIARHLFVRQRMPLETIAEITGIGLPELRQLRDAEQWVKELAAYRVPVSARSLNEEVKSAAQTLQVFLVQQCEAVAKTSVEYDHKTFDSLSKMIRSIQYMIGQFAFLNVSIIQDVMNGLTDFCIAEVSKSRMEIADMNIVFHAAQMYCERELNAVAPDDVYYELPDADDSDNERDDSPASAQGREATASASALVASP